MPARVTLVTLGVADLARSVAFYEALGWQRSSASNEQVAFFQLGPMALSLYGAADLAHDAGQPAAAAGFRGCTLAINLESTAEVDRVFAAFEAAGGTALARPETAFWGGYTSYIADPDHHVWELAWNPGFPLQPDGSIVLPA